IRQSVEPLIKRTQLRMIFQLLQAGNDFLASILPAELKECHGEPKRQKRRGPRRGAVWKAVQDLAPATALDSLSDGNQLGRQQLPIQVLRRILLQFRRTRQGGGEQSLHFLAAVFGFLTAALGLGSLECLRAGETPLIPHFFENAG